MIHSNPFFIVPLLYIHHILDGSVMSLHWVVRFKLFSLRLIPLFIVLIGFSIWTNSIQNLDWLWNKSKIYQDFWDTDIDHFGVGKLCQSQWSIRIIGWTQCETLFINTATVNLCPFVNWPILLSDKKLFVILLS